MLRPPRDDEHGALTALCLASKALHGYDADFMAACVPELTVDGASLARGPACVAADPGSDAPLGFTQVLVEDGACWLEALFVDPPAIGTGLGRVLFDWAARTALARFAPREMIIAADPGAVPFYHAMGAALAGEVPSDSIPGRSLPRLMYRFARS